MKERPKEQRKVRSTSKVKALSLPAWLLQPNAGSLQRPSESTLGVAPDGLGETFQRNKVLIHQLPPGKLTEMGEAWV